MSSDVAKNICRLCSRESHMLESVFGFEGGRLISDLITIICPIKIAVEDWLPKKVCNECLEVVISANKLRETSVRSDISFRTKTVPLTEMIIKEEVALKLEDDILQFNDYDDDEEESAEVYCEPQISLDGWNDDHPSRSRYKPEADRRYYCNVCTQSFAHHNNIKRHFLRFHDEATLPFACDQCTFRFRTKKELKNHQLRHETGFISVRPPRYTSDAGKTSQKKPKIAKLNPGLAYQCDICAAEFTKPNNVGRHKRKIHNEDIQSKLRKLDNVMQCDLCKKRFLHKKNLKLHMTHYHLLGDADNSFKQEQYHCPICEFVFSAKFNLERHISTIHDPQLRPLACKFAGCNERFKNEVKLKSHQIFHDSNDLKVLADHTPGYECDVCQMKFTIKGNMMRHQHKFHSLNLPFGCIYCSSRFRTERMMKTHVERKHSKISSPQPIQNLKQIVQPSSSELPCELCGIAFPSKRRLERHLLKDHELDETYKCDLCSKKFAFRQTLDIHIQTHRKKIRTQSFPYQCSTCKRRYTNEQTLIRHVNNKHKESKYVCHICGRTLCNSTTLDYHVKRHQSTRDFPCPQCPAQFVGINELERHVLIHKDDRPYVCSVETCGKTFKLSETLQKHIKRHQGLLKKKHFCEFEFCDKAFYSRYALLRHRRIHTGEKPFQCSYCEMAYTQKGDLLKHLQRTHVGDALYCCEFESCLASYRLKSELTDHYKVHYQN